MKTPFAIVAHLSLSRFVAGSEQNCAHSTQQPPVRYYIIVVSAFLQAFEVSSGNNKLHDVLTKGNFFQGGKYQHKTFVILSETPMSRHSSVIHC